MAFENHSRPGIAEVASRIAMKYDVIYNIKLNVFKGSNENVTKATAALEKWATAERIWNRC
jgi:hypothetical protein